jgi:VWFA-related protein
MTRPVPLVAMAVLWLSTCAAAQEPLTFEVEVDMVRVDVVVTHEGRPLTGLTAADLEVLDNGVPQRVEVVDPGLGQIAAHAILVLDTSGSTAGEKLRKLRAAGHAFVEGLGERDSVDLITFSDDVRLVREEEWGRQAVYEALDQAASGGTTALNDAIFMALCLGEPSAGRPIILVFTDGVDNVSWLDVEKVQAAARASEAVVYVVLETLQILGRLARDEELVDEATRFLLSVAEDTGGRVWHAKSLDDLRTSFLAVLDEVRSRYLLRYEPQGVTREGWHELNVRLKRGKGDVRTRRGYQRGSAGSSDIGAAGRPRG